MVHLHHKLILAMILYCRHNCLTYTIGSYSMSQWLSIIASTTVHLSNSKNRLLSPYRFFHASDDKFIIILMPIPKWIIFFSRQHRRTLNFSLRKLPAKEREREHDAECNEMYFDQKERKDRILTNFWISKVLSDENDGRCQQLPCSLIRFALFFF